MPKLKKNIISFHLKGLSEVLGKQYDSRGQKVSQSCRQFRPGSINRTVNSYQIQHLLKIES